MGKINIVFQAIPFCFGPGAQTLAIAHQLRSFLGTRLNLIDIIIQEKNLNLNIGTQFLKFQRRTGGL